MSIGILSCGTNTFADSGRMSIEKEREDALKHKSMKEIDTPANGADIPLNGNGRGCWYIC